MSKVDNTPIKRLQKKILYMMLGLFFLILLLLISWSKMLSPSVRSQEPDVMESVQLVPIAPIAPIIPSAPANSAQKVPVTAAPHSETAPVAEYVHPPHIPVLNYHSITIDPGNRAVITPEKFEAQMRYLADHGYNTLTLQQFIDYMDNQGTLLPVKPILLTFDDGYADNYQHAMPLLQKLQFKATLFVSPGTTDDGYFLNWDQIKEMHQAGWDIQPHGMTHPHLPKLSLKAQAFEISESKRQIEETLQVQARVFCYPYGERNNATLKLLQDNGFQYAFTIEQGMTTKEQHPLQLKRIFVNGEETLEQWISRLEKAAR